MRRHVSYARRERRVDRLSRHPLAATRWHRAARQAPHLRHRQGRRGQDDRLRGARAGGRGGRAAARSSARSPQQERVSRAFQREGVAARDRGRAGREPVGDLDRPQPRAPGVALQAARRRPAGAPARALLGVPVLRRRRAGRARDDHDREGLRARPARALGPPPPHLRPRDRRRAGLRPRPGDAHDAPDVRRDRARRPDQAPGREDLDDARRPQPHRLPGGRARGGDAGQRDARARRPARGRGRPRPRRGRRQRPLPRALHAGRGASAAQRRRERPRARRRSTAVRAALAEHERSRQQQAHVRRLRKEAGAPVLELPLLFEPAGRARRVPVPRRGADRRGSRRRPRTRRASRSSRMPCSRVVTGA